MGNRDPTCDILSAIAQDTGTQLPHLMLWIAATFASPGWDIELGGELSQTPAGIANVRWRHENGLSLALITDTVDLRLERGFARGRAWVAGRVELGAAGMVHSPWTDGAPDPSRAQLGLYAGPEGGAVWHLGGGFWAGAQATARAYGFVASSTNPSPSANRVVLTPEAIAGWWTESADLSVRAGASWSVKAFSPHLHGQLSVHPEGPVAPFFELRAGVAEGTDVVTKTRLGGLNPYVVPLAGAAWAELWVEDYAALRAGPRLWFGKSHLSVVVDSAVFDGRTETGLAGLLHLASGHVSADVSVGVSPGLRREGDRLAGSTFVLLGYHRPPGPREPATIRDSPSAR